MTKYYIMIKCTNNSTCKNVRLHVGFAQTILKKEILVRGKDQV